MHTDTITLVASIAAALFGGIALAIAWRQLSVARNAAGGRGVELQAHDGGVVTFHEGGRRTHGVHITVRLVGPGVRHNVQAVLRGTPDLPNIEDARPAMDCDSEPIVWHGELAEEDCGEVWCVVSWVDPRGEGLRTSAICKPLTSDDLYEWKWHRFFTVRLRWQLRFGDGPRPLGHWKLLRMPPLEMGHGPLAALPSRVSVAAPQTRTKVRSSAT